MKENLNLINANIENLTSLWKTASAKFGALFEGPVFNYCEIENSDWPNRLWCNQDISKETVEVISDFMSQRTNKLTLPYWDIYNNESYKYIEACGGVIVFEQTAMSLKLNQSFKQDNKLEFRRVIDISDAKTWEEIYPQAFGYRISKETLISTYDDISYYLAFYRNQAAGTAILYNTGKISGIHGIGVIPEMRKMGFADEIMKFILNKALDSNSEYATLQASLMGKNLYLKLGFEEQFSIKNYIFPKLN